MTLELHETVSAEIESYIKKNGLAPRRRSERRDPFEALWLLSRNEDDTLAGACHLRLRVDWMTIETVWVAVDRRRQGLGTALLLAAEELARTKGLRGIEATIYGFEAPAFFLGAGFQAVGQLESSRPDLCRSWVVKSFTPLKLAFPVRPPRAAARAATASG